METAAAESSGTSASKAGVAKGAAWASLLPDRCVYTRQALLPESADIALAEMLQEEGLLLDSPSPTSQPLPCLPCLPTTPGQPPPQEKGNANHHTGDLTLEALGALCSNSRTSRFTRPQDQWQSHLLGHPPAPLVFSTSPRTLCSANTSDRPSSRCPPLHPPQGRQAAQSPARGGAKVGHRLPSLAGAGPLGLQKSSGLWCLLSNPR